MNTDFDLEEEELTPQQKAQLRESSRLANLNPREGSDWPSVRARLFPFLEQPAQKAPPK